MAVALTRANGAEPATTLAAVEGLTFTYAGAADPALTDVSLSLRPRERIAVLGPSGSGKSTLLRALAGLVPHFHGGCFAGKVVVQGYDTRVSRPSELAGIVASVFQDPEDQVVMTRVANEVAFGLENVGAPPGEIWPRVAEALARVGAGHLADRSTRELSGGELQRVSLAAALALEPELLLLDEPTSQLDPDGAEAFLDAVARLDVALVISEQRVGRALTLADRVLFLEHGRLLLDAPREDAEAWLARCRPSYAAPSDASGSELRALDPPGAPVVRLEGAHFSYGDHAVLDGVDLELRKGEIVVLHGPNGAGKSTLAKIAAGLLEPSLGRVERMTRAAYLSQDPGRYLVKESALAEVAIGAGGDRARARAALARMGLASACDRHPRDLSSGERERLGVAAVGVTEPGFLVLDEPTRGVDPDRKIELVAWVKEQAAAGRAVLIVTHDRAFPAHRRLRLTREERLRGV